MPDSPKKILIVDDEESMREWLSIFLKKEGYRIFVAPDAETANRTLEKEPLDLVICDIRLPGHSGIEVLRFGRKISPDTDFIMITAYASTESAVEAMKLGAADFIIKPFDLDEFRLKIESTLENRSMREENIYLRQQLQQSASFDEIHGTSAKIRDTLSMVQRIAPTDSTVLIQGESGTGKELIARALHFNSPRKNYKFISVNCGAIPENLIESELFGHVKGAFTDAFENKKGLLEAAHRGTVFLDEISDMPAAMQVKLLRVLQERKIRRVGGIEESDIDIRVVAATNKDIELMVEKGEFREDLYYRINVISLAIPPLRDRKEDIPVLADLFLKRSAEKMQKNVREFTGEARSLLSRYAWPGNVRELENAVEHAVAMATTEAVLPAQLPETVRAGHWAFPRADELVIPESFELEEHLDEIRRRYLMAALRKSEGNKTRAAENLGISFRSFRYLIKKLKLGE